MAGVRECRKTTLSYKEELDEDCFTDVSKDYDDSYKESNTETTESMVLSTDDESVDLEVNVLERQVSNNNCPIIILSGHTANISIYNSEPHTDAILSVATSTTTSDGKRVWDKKKHLSVL